MNEYFDSCFVSHAPFLLVDNRDSIKRYEIVNIEFLHGIAELAADALLCLRDIGKDSNLLVTDNIYRILNVKNAESETDDKNIYLKQCFLNVVRANKMLLNKSGEYANINDVYSTTKELESLLSSAQLRQLCGKEGIDFIYLKDYRSDFRDVEQSLEISSFNNSILANRLSTSYMEKQNEEWADRLLNYIEENAIKLWRTNDKRNITEDWYGVKQDNWSSLLLRFAPIAKVQGGEWIAPYTLYKEGSNVCLPYNGYEDAGEDAFGKVLDNGMFEKHEVFYRGIGLKEPDMADYIEKTLLAKYEGDNVPNDNVLKKDFVYIYNLLHKSENSRIKNTVCLEWKLKQIEDFGTTLCHINKLCLPTEDFLSFVNHNESFRFVDCAFYAEGTGMSYDDVEEFFRHNIGIKDRPNVNKVFIEAEKLYRREKYCYTLSNLPQQAIDFLETQNLAITIAPTFEDFQLEGYNINNCSYAWSHAYWRFLAKIDNELKFMAGKLNYHLYNDKRYYYIKDDIDSSLLFKLKTDKWIAKSDGTFCCPSEISEEDFHRLGYEENSNIESKLVFLDRFQAEKIKEEQRIKEEEEKLRREEGLRQLSAKGISPSAIDSLLALMATGKDVEKMLNAALLVENSGVNVEAILEAASNGKNIDIYSSINAKYEASESCHDTQQYNDSELPQEITSNIAPLMEIVQTVGPDSLPYVAEHVDDMMNFMLDEKSPNMSRRIINYIGKKIYEQYLVNEGIKFEAVEGGLSDCDYNINDGEKYVSVVSTKKSIADNRIPVGISATQNAFLRKHPDAQIRIVRISFMDISILSQYERIVDIYGKGNEPMFNERLRKECDELAINYWKGADIGEFDAVSPEYSIKVERKNK